MHYDVSSITLLQYYILINLIFTCSTVSPTNMSLSPLKRSNTHCHFALEPKRNAHSEMQRPRAAPVLVHRCERSLSSDQASRRRVARSAPRCRAVKRNVIENVRRERAVAQQYAKSETVLRAARRRRRDSRASGTAPAICHRAILANPFRTA